MSKTPITLSLDTNLVAKLKSIKGSTSDFVGKVIAEDFLLRRALGIHEDTIEDYMGSVLVSKVLDLKNRALQRGNNP